MLSNSKWKYGDSWEKYPIKPGQVWEEEKTGSLFLVYDIMKGRPGVMFPSGMVYCDPPWNLGNVNSFITKNNSVKYIDEFSMFYKKLFSVIWWYNPSVCFLEIGKQHLPDFEKEMNNLFPSVQTWEITYYKKNPCYLIRGGILPTDFDFTGKDDSETPFLAIQNEGCSCVADFCTGRGLTAISAFRQGKQFVGTELNKRRLAVAIDKIAQLGGKFKVL
jgi:hypothetical protein